MNENAIELGEKKICKQGGFVVRKESILGKHLSNSSHPPVGDRVLGRDRKTTNAIGISAIKGRSLPKIERKKVHIF